jgi:UDP-glucuronate 4-epimerase
MQRDFTFVDDIVEGTVRVMDRIAAPTPGFDTYAPDPAGSFAPYRVYNIGNHRPVELMTFIETLEDALGQRATKNFLPMQAGDVLATFADIDDLRHDVGFEPKTSLNDGLSRWAEWFREYRKAIR